MNKTEYTFHRDLCLLEIEAEARKAFTNKKGELEPAFWTVQTPIFTADEIKKQRSHPILDRQAPSQGLSWEQHGTFTAWLSIGALITAAERLLPGFEALFSPSLHAHPYQVRISLPGSSSDCTAKDVYNSLKMDLVNAFFYRKHGLIPEPLIPQPVMNGRHLD